MSPNAWVRADEGGKHETAPRCQLIPHDRGWLCEAINMSADIRLSTANMDIFRKQASVVISLGLVFFPSNWTAFFTPDLEVIYSISQGASPWHWLYFPLHIRICLLRESERLFVSLKVSHTFDHDCARLCPPPRNVHLRASRQEDVHRETQGRTIVVYRTHCLLLGDKSPENKSSSAGTVCSITDAFYQEMNEVKRKRTAH